MKTLEWRHLDKSKWPDRGPWDDEPDKAQWRDPETGLACLANRHPTMGHWCGYVGVPEGHPWFGQTHDGDPENVTEVHGGLTFSDRCHPGKTEAEGICHVTEPGDPEVWWFGFDCAHAWDLSPGYQSSREKSSDTTYKTLAYVRDECTSLARQIVKVAQ